MNQVVGMDSAEPGHVAAAASDNMTGPHYSDRIAGLFTVFTSACCFYIFSKFVKNNLTPKSAEHADWRWKNLFVSMIHSIVTGLGAIFCLLERYQAGENPVFTHTPMGSCLVALSVGYFLYDMVDLWVAERSRQTLELELHHITLVICFGCTVFKQMYIGYSLFGLLVEVNSCFLHIRGLLQILKVPKNNVIFRTNSIINLVTYATFRICTLIWMIWYLYMHQHRVSVQVYYMAASGLVVVTVMSMVLLVRLLISDFCSKPKSKPLLTQNGHTPINAEVNGNVKKD